ncbi:hypothetical protein EDC61_10639 [Sulfuritortus calidifontis]|uniref:DUF484 family protein n=1 Tax=Sulfuritortus calidifontis TaxID=1914471 RepID=A0A4V2UQQ7_9PROT|nr:DUF484 family protein [Sulfuritortus calidifontis]TCS72125.1 hypothetical protein EDC61_10639 [Sulfuritortus calidifontis]
MSTDIITHEQVARFLQDNPEFFAHYTELLSQINVPHPHSGQAISIGERQVLMLRDKARGLENRLKEFIQFAEENDAIGEKLHRLSLDLMRARDLESALQALYLNLGESFAVPHVAVRLWTGQPQDLPEFGPVSEDIRVMAEGLTAPQCGHSVPEEVRAWLGEAGPHQQSFALAPLKEANMKGLLVLSSEDARRFYPEMGTLYLQWLAELTGAALSRFV